VPTAVIYIRVSSADQASVSVATQERMCREVCERNGWTVRAVHVDENVSGAIAPEDRAGMACVLADLAQVDYVVSVKLDRLSRRTAHLHALVDTFRAAGVHPVTADGFINEHTAGFMIGLFAWLAEMERDRTRERTTASAAEILAAGRVRTLAPYGYVIERRNGGAFLAVDPVAADIIRDLAGRLLAGATISDLTAWLNRNGVPTPRQHAAARAGRTVKPAKWSGSVLKKMLISPALRGIRTRWVDGLPTETYREDGTPDVIADPILDASIWHQVREVISARSKPQTRPARTDSPCSRVTACGVCESLLIHGAYTRRGKAKRGYRCPNRCVHIDADHLDRHMSRWYTRTFGTLEVYREEIDQGHDVTAELADVERALSGLTAAIEANPGAAAVLGARVAELTTKRDTLRAERDKPREVRRVATGQTYADVWEDADGMTRRGLLQAAGVHVSVSRGVRGRKGFDPDRVRVTITDADHDQAAEALADVITDAA
jgi:DNA invertase Pin-like site-specific DNA recombinase